MRTLRSALIILAAVMCIGSVSCGKHEKIKEDSEIERELENKYGRDFELIEQTSEKDSAYMSFLDDKDVKFRVKCIREHNIAADSHLEYSDDYVSSYLEKYSDEYLAGFKAAGIDAEINEDDMALSLIKFSVYSYSQLDALFDEINRLEPPIKYDSYIRSAVAEYCCGDLKLGTSSDDEAEIRQFYADSVRRGDISEELPEAVLREYPAYDMEIYINGVLFDEGRDVSAVYFKDSDDIRISFDMTCGSSGVDGKFDDFLGKLGCKDVKSSRSGFEWDGGSIKFSDRSFDFVSTDKDHSDPELARTLTLRLTNEDIERIFGAKTEYDPVFTGRIDIIT